MIRIKLFLQQHMLWVGFFAFIIQLFAMLWMQYNSLLQLKKTSAVADKMALKSHLVNIVKEIQFNYQSNSERLLNFPSTAFDGDNIFKYGCCFKGGWSGAKLLFLTSFA